MLKNICNIKFQKNTFLNKDNNIFNVMEEKDLSKFTLDELNKYLKIKEIKFDNIFTKKKKDDCNITECSNFVINNLLNVFNNKDVTLDTRNIKNNNTQKKKIDIDKNILLDNKKFLKNIINSQGKKNKNTSKEEPLISKSIKNKNKFFHINELNNINVIKISSLKKIKNEFFHKKTSLVNESNITPLKNERKFFFLNNKNYKNSLLSFKNINKIDYLMSKKKLLNNFYKKDSIKSNIEPLILNNSKNSIEWKKLISQKILLSIFNKKNKAEIHLKPESLGTIYIKINIKNNKVVLDFFSNHYEVRFFLDTYKPFLRDSLIKNGIKLDKFRINSFFKKNDLKTKSNVFYKKIFNLEKLQKKINVNKKKLEFVKYKKIDIYV